jgi:hypothetical protein
MLEKNIYNLGERKHFFRKIKFRNHNGKVYRFGCEQHCTVL